MTKPMNIFSNPIIRRNLVSQMRRERLIGVSVSYVGLIVLICLFICLWYYAEHNSSLNLTAICKSMHLSLLILQFVLYFVVGFNLSSLAIVREREQGTYEFFKTLPMSYGNIIIGTMIGPTLFTHWLQLITFPLTIFSGLLGKVPILVMVKLYIVLAFGGFCLNALGLLVSSMARKQSPVNLCVLSGMALFIGVPCIGIAIYEGYEANYVSLLSPITLFLQYFLPYYGEKAFNSCISFFELKVPILVYTCLIYACLGTTFLVGIFRKLKDETALPFSRRHVLFLFLIFEVILIGFMRDVFRLEDFSPMESLSAFFQISWFVLLGLSLISTPDYASVFAWLRNRKAGTKQLLNDLFTHSGSPILGISILGYLIMAIVGLSAYAYLPHPFVFGYGVMARFVVALSMLFGYLLAYLILAQLAALLSKEHGLTLGIAFVLILYILPFLLAGFSSLEFFLLFSPTSGSYLSNAFASDKGLYASWWYSLLVSYSLSIVFGLLLWSRMKNLQSSR